MSRNIMPGKINDRIVAFPHLSVTASAESDALAAATTANWLDVTGWRTDLGAAQLSTIDVSAEQFFTGYPQFEIDIESDATETLTGTPKLYAVRLAPVTIADDTFTATGSDAVLTAVAHGMLTGDGPFFCSSSDTLPAPLSATVPYWVEKTAANTFELYTSRALAIASGTGIVTTDSGTGTHTIADVQSSANGDDDTRRCRFTLVGKLNAGDDIVVGAQVAYTERINHSTLDLYYMVVATETSAQTITIRVTPVMSITE